MPSHFPLAALSVVAAATLVAGPSALQESTTREEAGRSAQPEAGVQVHGKVVSHASNDPLSGATVSLGGVRAGTPGRGTRVTDDEGRFSFEGVPEGEYRLTVTSVGYHDITDTLQVPEQGDLDLILPLSTDPIRLEPIVVSAKPSPAPLRSYERRRIAGGSGFLVTRKDIEERRPRFLSELLHGVHGGMVVPTPPHGYTLLLRGQCRPGIWMDGVKLTGATSVDQLITPQDVEAVEVYHGFELPVELGVDRCGGILIWTRQGPSRPSVVDDEERSGLFGRLMQVIVVVALVIIVAR